MGDNAKGEFTNGKEANRQVKPSARKGWELKSELQSHRSPHRIDIRRAAGRHRARRDPHCRDHNRGAGYGQRVHH
jgi:hypothetical protein